MALAVKLVLIVFFFVASAIISGSEVAYFSRKSPSRLAQVKAFGLLATILLLNNVSNSYLSSLVADVLPASDLFVALGLSVAITVFSELLPKRLAMSHPHLFVKITEFIYEPLATVLSILKIRVEADTTKITTYAVMEAVVDAIQNSEMTPEERLNIAKILYAIHAKGYTLLYPISESPILRFEMSVREALELLERENYDRDWVPVYHIDPNFITHMVHVETLRKASPDEPIMDLPMDQARYFPLLGSFTRILNIVEDVGHLVLIDEYGNSRGFSYRKDVELWMLSAGDVLPMRTSLLELYIITGRELGPINWDLADLFQFFLGRSAEDGDSIIVQDVKLTVVRDIFVKVEIL
ncbi:MAG: hypothetical protein GXO29_01810 [Thermotogae bacterium]|nr:hypothetical protein [Thermotogota bacterium]